MNYKTYVRFIDSHSEGDCCDDNVNIFHQKFILCICTHGCFEAGMIRQSTNTIYG